MNKTKLRIFFEDISDIAIKAFNADNCFFLASAISYYALFSMLPLMIVLVSIFGKLLGSNEQMMAKLIEFFRQAIPFSSPEVIANLTGLVTLHSAMSFFGILVLLWSGDYVINSMEYSLNIVFKTRKFRKFILSKLISLGLMALLGLAIVFSIFVTAAINAIQQGYTVVLGFDLGAYIPTGMGIGVIMPVLALMLLFAGIITILPNTRIKFTYAIMGGGIFAVLWIIAKEVFAWYIRNFGKFNVFYGSIGALVIVILWIYYSFTILLLCAELVSIMQRKWEIRLEKGFVALMDKEEIVKKESVEASGKKDTDWEKWEEQ
jgi:membrane protein